MDALGQYVISVTAAALICGIVSCLVQSGTAKELIRLLCGLFLAFTVIRPLAGLDFSALTSISFPYTQEADSIATQGENIAREAMADIIKADAEAYILDKAAALNADLTVDITLSREDTPVPVRAELSGSVSPYARQQLTYLLQTDLGIAKENQLWTG